MPARSSVELATEQLFDGFFVGVRRGGPRLGHFCFVGAMIEQVPQPGEVPGVVVLPLLWGYDIGDVDKGVVQDDQPGQMVLCGDRVRTSETVQERGPTRLAGRLLEGAVIVVEACPGRGVKPALHQQCNVGRFHSELLGEAGRVGAGSG